MLPTSVNIPLERRMTGITSQELIFDLSVPILSGVIGTNGFGPGSLQYACAQL